MSVNVHVNVRRCMAVDDCLQWSVHVSVSFNTSCDSKEGRHEGSHEVSKYVDVERRVLV